MTAGERKLARLRRQVDAADRALLRALAARFRATRQIGLLKIALGLPMLQQGRWRKVMSDRLKRARALGLEPRFVRALWELIHAESIRRQK